MLTPYLRSVSLAALAALVAACGGTDTPVGPTADATAPSTDRAFLALDSELHTALRGSGKAAWVPEDGRSVSRQFRPGQRASMTVEDLNRRGVRDDLVVRFGVGRGSLDHAASITMTVFGNTLSELLLAFEPAGLEFDDPATLRITIGAGRVDTDLLDLTSLVFPFAAAEADHEHDGQTEPARIVSIRTYVRTLLGDLETHNLLLYDYAVIEIEVPGFSRYSLRR